MKKYHVNFYGILGECEDKEGRCPFGSYNSPEEAQTAYENSKSDQNIATLKKVTPKKQDETLPIYDYGTKITSEMAVYGLDEYSEEQMQDVNLINLHTMMNIEGLEIPFVIEDHTDGYFDNYYEIYLGDEATGLKITINADEIDDVHEARTYLAEKTQEISINELVTEYRLLDDSITVFEHVDKANEELAKIKAFGINLENINNPEHETAQWESFLEENVSNDPSVEAQNEVQVSSSISNDEMYDEDIQFELFSDYELTYGSITYGEDNFQTALEAPNGNIIEFDTSEIATVEDFRIQAREHLKRFDAEEAFKFGMSIGQWDGKEDYDETVIEGKKKILEDRDFFLGVARCIKEDLELMK